MVVSSNGRKQGFHPCNMGSIPVTATIRQAFNHHFQSLKGNQEALTRIFIGLNYHRHRVMNCDMWLSGKRYIKKRSKLGLIAA